MGYQGFSSELGAFDLVDDVRRRRDHVGDRREPS